MFTYSTGTGRFECVHTQEEKGDNSLISTFESCYGTTTFQIMFSFTKYFVVIFYRHDLCFNKVLGVFCCNAVWNMMLHCALYCHISYFLFDFFLNNTFLSNLHTIATLGSPIRVRHWVPIVTSKTDLFYKLVIAHVIEWYIGLCYTPQCFPTLCMLLFVCTGSNLVWLFSCPGKCSSSFESLYTSVSCVYGHFRLAFHLDCYTLSAWWLLDC